MSYKVKGTAGPVIQDRRFQYEPEDATYYLETTYGGSARAIEGQSAAFRQMNRAHVSYIDPNGTGQTILRTPVSVKPQELENTVRYEIVTEFIEQDIFRHKTVSDAADVFDASPVGIGGGMSFRKRCEAGVDEFDAELETASPTAARVIQHLRKGITGFEREYIILRRSRKIPFAGVQGQFRSQVAILDGRFIYDTEQLGLPEVIAFSLPALGDLPASNWDDVIWGWRRRPSGAVFTGDFSEQSSEFILAEWSLLTYEKATTAAGW